MNIIFVSKMTEEEPFIWWGYASVGELRDVCRSLPSFKNNHFTIMGSIPRASKALWGS